MIDGTGTDTEVALADVFNNLGSCCLDAAEAEVTKKDDRKMIPEHRHTTNTKEIQPKRRKFFLLKSLWSDAIRT